MLEQTEHNQAHREVVGLRKLTQPQVDRHRPTDERNERMKEFVACGDAKSLGLAWLWAVQTKICLISWAWTSNAQWFNLMRETDTVMKYLLNDLSTAY